MSHSNLILQLNNKGICKIPNVVKNKKDQKISVSAGVMCCGAAVITSSTHVLGFYGFALSLSSP